jgi:PAS domain S-box-containing protein
MAEKKMPKTPKEKVKKAEKTTTARLKKEIANAEGIMSAIGDGISIHDRTFTILYENKKQRDLMGVHVGEKCYSAYQKRQDVCGGCPVALTFKDGKVHTVQREMQTDEGTRYAEITASPLKDLTGKTIAGIEVVRDITERKIIEEELKKTGENLEFLVRTAPVALYTSKASGDYGATFIGGSVKSLLGFRQEDFTSNVSFWAEHIHPDDKERVFKNVSYLFEHGHHVHEYRFRHADGTYRWMHDECKLIYDNKGTPIQIIGYWIDITDYKKLEEQLSQAQKMEAIGQLAGGIAHDFNNILTAIIGFGTLLKTETDENDLQRYYTTQILTAAERAVNLTQALLTFGRKQIISPKPVNLNEIIKAIKNLLSRIIGEDVELSIFLTEKDLTILADSGQIEQVLMNLATNARDAMQDGGRLTIKTDYIELDNEFIMAHGYGTIASYAFISTEDTGQGMDEETKARIFEPFFTTKEVGKGTGLGLSMVYGIIKQHNGHINVYSELGKGTTFEIYLPLIKSTVEKGKESVLPTIKRGTETVLVAEDDAQVRQLVKEVLEGNGYKVIKAKDGGDAVKLFSKNKDETQLLILDVVMPKKNGKKAYDEIKKIRPDIKAIFISGHDINKKELIKEGLTFITKPVLPDNLLREVRAVLDKENTK